MEVHGNALPDSKAREPENDGRLNLRNDHQIVALLLNDSPEGSKEIKPRVNWPEDASVKARLRRMVLML